jgi:hypothetical protein
VLLTMDVGPAPPQPVRGAAGVRGHGGPRPGRESPLVP